MTEPVRFDPSVEQPADREDELTREILDLMAQTQGENAERHRHAHRDAHAKSHAVVKASLTVHDGLPAELAQGVFAAPATYEVVARLSSAPGDISSDTVPSARGFAIKIIGVEGERLLPSLGGHNQDFLMVNVPTLAFGTIGTYRQAVGPFEQSSAVPELVRKVTAAGARVAEDVVERVTGSSNATLDGLGRDNDNPLGETYFTQAAVRYGDHIAKVSLAPRSESVRALTGQPVDVEQFSSLRDSAVAFFETQGAEYDVRVQLRTDLESMPVEDAAVLWDEDVSPFRTVGTLTIEPQSCFSPARQRYGDDVLSFNPWNGVVEHQPLGSIMRVRKPAYERSTEFRHSRNDVARLEPDSLDQIPD